MHCVIVSFETFGLAASWMMTLSDGNAPLSNTACKPFAIDCCRLVPADAKPENLLIF